MKRKVKKKTLQHRQTISAELDVCLAEKNAENYIL
jgi:hypothetical protein